MKKNMQFVFEARKLEKAPGFTLIELLIVVAIIGILAAIAVPNFLSAQVRAKVARVQSEFHTTGTGLESYAADYSVYPPDDWVLQLPDKNLPTSFRFSTTLWRLTTPIPYLKTLPAADPFKKELPPVEDNYVYYFDGSGYNQECTPDLPKHMTPIRNWDPFDSLGGGGVSPHKRYLWKLDSYGPDKKDTGGWILYDPTNGVVSLGTIIRWGP